MRGPRNEGEGKVVGSPRGNVAVLLRGTRPNLEDGTAPSENKGQTGPEENSRKEYKKRREDDVHQRFISKKNQER